MLKCLLKGDSLFYKPSFIGQALPSSAHVVLPAFLSVKPLQANPSHPAIFRRACCIRSICGRHRCYRFGSLAKSADLNTPHHVCSPKNNGGIKIHINSICLHPVCLFLRQPSFETLTEKALEKKQRRGMPVTLRTILPATVCCGLIALFAVAI